MPEPEILAHNTAYKNRENALYNIFSNSWKMKNNAQQENLNSNNHPLKLYHTTTHSCDR